LRWMLLFAIALSLCAFAAPASADRRETPLMIQTAPAAPGIRFALDGKRFRSDAHGLALIRVRHRGLYRLRVIDDAMSHQDRRRVFVGWSDGPTVPSRTIKIDTFTWMRATFEVSYRVSPRFTDADGNDIAAPNVDGLILRSDDGTKTTLSGGGPYWIVGESASSKSDVGYSKKISYVVAGVLVDGEELRPVREDSLVPGRSTTWTIPLLPAPEPPAPEEPRLESHGPVPWVPWLIVGGAVVAVVAVMLLGARRHVKLHARRHALRPAINPAPEPGVSTHDEITELDEAFREVELLTERIESARRSLVNPESHRVEKTG
jgi:hypothetical protein